MESFFPQQWQQSIATPDKQRLLRNQDVGSLGAAGDEHEAFKLVEGREVG